ncbi:hypothetical protein GCG54_00014706 [Colletotrichum gloeosporioides]|uniref:Heterokaryon incompatibility domain-containing protein n=1 Tax=Colletotrichum gloeosporioides TaxID=474922 RepID=A0A8H4CD51_COLGL|nr:uncharacterized protein GCG54_00014706 [Colletotrichum gloeosporioides]KAF3801492.1 hypothetical protein GCG54_00014706 [Colletotrichum gloeosporioides]
MSRWHHAGCLSPQVEIKNGLPECRTCDYSPDLAALMPTNASSILTIPEDERSGSMNLWWPRSVPYCNNAKSCNEGDCLTGGNPKARVPSAPDQTVPDLATTTTAATPGSSTIYSQTLKHTDIRLAVLTHSESHEFPVHLDLEIYELDDCPEYEAVSYLWGGEDDDTTLCCPIYVGPF